MIDQGRVQTAVALEPEEISPRTSPRVLLAEDDDEMRALLAAALRKDGYEVTACGNGINLLGHISAGLHGRRSGSYDLVVSDIRMPGLTALEVFEDLRGHSTPPPLILITAFGDERTHAQAGRLGARAVLDKPFQIDRLLEAAHRVVAPRRAQSEAKRYIEPGVTAGRILEEMTRLHGSRRRQIAAQYYCDHWVAAPGWNARIRLYEECEHPVCRCAVLREEGSGAQVIALDCDSVDLSGHLVTVNGRIKAVGSSRITLDRVSIRLREARDTLRR
jgi:DNA-binding response OmpR family regulator